MYKSHEDAQSAFGHFEQVKSTKLLLWTGKCIVKYSQLNCHFIVLIILYEGINKFFGKPQNEVLANSTQ